MSKEIIALLARYGQETVELIDHSPDYAAITETIGGEVVELPLDEGVVALCSTCDSQQIIRNWHNIVIVGRSFLIVGKSENDYVSLTAEQIKNLQEVFHG